LGDQELAFLKQRPHGVEIDAIAVDEEGLGVAECNVDQCGDGLRIAKFGEPKVQWALPGRE
jgi:hypothetical protein